MIVRRLKLANVRAVQSAEFRFQPGFNLIVGVNGVGKTSALDALGICLSAFAKRMHKLHHRVETFSAEDIRAGANTLTVECEVIISRRPYTYLVHKPRTASTPRKSKAGLPREQVVDTPEKAEFLGDAPAPVSGNEPGGRPLTVLFSTNRAVPSERAPSKASAAGGVDAAFADAFADRELRLGEFAAWLRVQQALRRDRPAAARALKALDRVVERFLPGYANLRLAGRDGQELRIDRGISSVPIRLLSDGERGTLALVLDLTRRLAQANPRMTDPANDAAGIVLIDEIDLHLHPKWQRQIVRNLTSTFPRCQFIATTHSPQVIGEVEHDRIQIIADGEVYSPTHSYGVDSSRVLEEVMEAAPRTKVVHDLLSEISGAVGRQKFDQARELLAKLIEKLGEPDPDVTRIRTLLDFVEGRE